MVRNRSASAESTDAQMKRSPHTIRFFDPEWERVEAFAEVRGLAPAELVRFATLTMIADGGASVAGLAPLIQTTFRATHILASKLRDQMLEAGEQDALDKMIFAARGLQADLIGPMPD